MNSQNSGVFFFFFLEEFYVGYSKTIWHGNLSTNNVKCDLETKAALWFRVQHQERENKNKP